MKRTYKNRFAEKCQEKLENVSRQIQIQKDNIILYGKERAEQEKEANEKRIKEIVDLVNTTPGSIRLLTEKEAEEKRMLEKENIELQAG